MLIVSRNRSKRIEEADSIFYVSIATLVGIVHGLPYTIVIPMVCVNGQAFVGHSCFVVLPTLLRNDERKRYVHGQEILYMEPKRTPLDATQ